MHRYIKQFFHGKGETVQRLIDADSLLEQRWDADTRCGYVQVVDVGSIEEAATVIDLSDDDFGTVLNCAIRYCLGRRTYMPGLVTSYIRPLLPFLNDKTLDVMKRDIDEQGKFGYGHECDYETWASFLRDIKAVRSSCKT